MFRTIGKILSGLNNKYIKPWFFSSDEPERIKAPYVISFVFLSLTVWAIIIHIAFKMWQFYEITKLWRVGGVGSLSQIETLSKVDMSLIPLISVFIGTAGMFIGLYNWGKKGKNSGLKSSPGNGVLYDDEV